MYHQSWLLSLHLMCRFRHLQYRCWKNHYSLILHLYCRCYFRHYYWIRYYRPSCHHPYCCHLSYYHLLLSGLLLLLLQTVLLHRSRPELHLDSEELHWLHQLLTEGLQVMRLYTCLLLRQLLLRLQPPFQAPLLQLVLSSLQGLLLLHLQLQPVHLHPPELRCHQPELHLLH